ncbi:MAG TPA: AsmA family protein [Methylophilus sp.]
MKNIIKYTGMALGGIVALVILLVAYFALTFNPNDYKQQIIDLVKEKKDRTLTIEGDIQLSFWPKIGADLGKVSVSEYQSSTVFASINSAKVALSVLPLLKKQLVVDTVYVDGVKANVIKRKDGSFNFDDLLSKEEEESKIIQFDVQGVNISNSEVTYTDESNASKYAISQFNMQSGPIALAKAFDLTADFNVTSNQPVVAAKVTLQGNFFADPENKHFKVKGLDTLMVGDVLTGKNVEIKVNGDVDAKTEQLEFLVDALKLTASGDFEGVKQAVALNAPSLNILKDKVSSEKVTVELSQIKADGDLKLNMILADLTGSPKALQSSGISGDIAMTQGKRKVVGKFASPFSGNLEQMVFEIPKLVGQLDIQDPTLPNGAIKGSFNLAAHADVKKELANSQFNLNVADTKLNGDVAVASFKQPNIKFNLIADKLNLNQLLGKSSAAAKKPATSKASNQPPDLSALSTLLLDGKVKVGSILYDPYRLSGLNVAIKADGKKLALTGLNVKLDDSQIKGNFAISQFKRALYTFDLDIDQINLDNYMAANAPAKADSSASKSPSQSADKPLDLSALKALNAEGSIRVGQLKYGKTKASNINIKLEANGEKVNLKPLSAKVDDSQVRANVNISQLSNPMFNFDVNIDKLDADRYIAKNEAATPTKPANKSSADTPIDLSALKKLNATGEANIGWLKIANVKTQNVKLGLQADNGVVMLQPFAANLYQGSMSGSLKVDARATPTIVFKQSMQNVAIAPLMVDAINNDMLAGTGAVNIEVTTQGNSVNALKKALAGNAALNLADGAVKGIDIAGSIRDMKNKLNVLKQTTADADSRKKTDFSELTASFVIKNGVAHNEDLAMKAPILRLGKGDSRGDIDIANEAINYTAKPTIVKSLKGQGGAELDQLSGISIPVKITGSFAKPKFGMDLAAVGTALAQSKLLDKVGGEKGAAVKELIGGDNKVDALKGLLGKKKAAEAGTTPATGTAPAPAGEAAPTNTETAPQEAPKSLKEKALKELLNF